MPTGGQPACGGADSKRPCPLQHAHRCLLQGPTTLAAGHDQDAGARNRPADCGAGPGDFGGGGASGQARGWHDGHVAGYAGNQERYPQQSNQQPGLGFPIARLVGLLCLATGAVLDAAMGPYSGKTGSEHALFRPLIDRIARET